MFNGPDFCPAKDQERLKTQLGRIITFMRPGGWHTLTQIAQALSIPESSVSAQLRHLRKPRFGSHWVKKRRADDGNGLFEYKVIFND